jgi:hypothetical protein
MSIYLIYDFNDFIDIIMNDEFLLDVFVAASKQEHLNIFFNSLLLFIFSWTQLLGLLRFLYPQINQKRIE